MAAEQHWQGFACGACTSSCVTRCILGFALASFEGQKPAGIMSEMQPMVVILSELIPSPEKS
eukprot:288107-Amphidinium_carterae.1